MFEHSIVDPIEMIAAIEDVRRLETLVEQLAEAHAVALSNLAALLPRPNQMVH